MFIYQKPYDKVRQNLKLSLKVSSHLQIRRDNNENHAQNNEALRER